MDDMLDFIQLRMAGLSPQQLFQEHLDERIPQLAQMAHDAAADVLQQQRQAEAQLEPLTAAVEGTELAPGVQEQMARIKQTITSLQETSEKLASSLASKEQELTSHEAHKAELQRRLDLLPGLFKKHKPRVPHGHVIDWAGSGLNNHIAEKVHPNGSYLPPLPARVQRHAAAAQRYGAR